MKVIIEMLLKAAVVGMGHWGKTLLNNFSNNSEIDVYAVSYLNSLMLFLSMSFSVMLLILGVLNSNITKALKEIVNYPSYNIKKSFKHFS